MKPPIVDTYLNLRSMALLARWIAVVVPPSVAIAVAAAIVVTADSPARMSSPAAAAT